MLDECLVGGKNGGGGLLLKSLLGDRLLYWLEDCGKLLNGR